MLSEKQKEKIISLGITMQSVSDIEKNGYSPDTIASGVEAEDRLNYAIYTKPMFDLIHEIFFDEEGEFYIDRDINNALIENGIQANVYFDKSTEYYNVCLSKDEAHVVIYSSEESSFRKKIPESVNVKDVDSIDG